VKIMLDTSAYVGFKRNAPEALEVIVKAELILFSPIVLGELMFGFRNGTQLEKNMVDLNSFLEHEAVKLDKSEKSLPTAIQESQLNLSSREHQFPPMTYGLRHKRWNKAQNLSRQINILRKLVVLFTRNYSGLSGRLPPDIAGVINSFFCLPPCPVKFLTSELELCSPTSGGISQGIRRRRGKRI